MRLLSRVIATASGNLNTVVAGVSTSAAALVIDLDVVRALPGSISALFTVDAETNTLTIEGGWQVSNDGSTWFDIADQNNAARVVLATGTAGADAAVSKVLVAPMAVHGWRYCRPVVVNRVATGNTVDTWAIELHHRRAA